MAERLAVLNKLAGSMLGRLSTQQKVAIAAAVFLLILFLAAKVAFWALLFILVASIAEVYNNQFRTPIHFDLVKLGTILASSAYGAGLGIFVGLASSFFSKLFSGRLNATFAISAVGIIIIAFLAAAFSEANITTLGISLVAVYYLITTPLNLMMGEEIAYAAAYVASSLLVNAFLFIVVAPRLAGLL